MMYVPAEGKLIDLKREVMRVHKVDVANLVSSSYPSYPPTSQTPGCGYLLRHLGAAQRVPRIR